MERADLMALARATDCAVERGPAVFLCDPNWSANDRAQAEAIMAESAAGEAGWLCVRTGGSAGAVKFARHDEETLDAAARGFLARFGLTQVNAVDVLPAHHVSGLMARIRCAVTGGVHRPWDWKRLEAGETPLIPGGDWVLSLVPTQLQRLLEMDHVVNWLLALKIIFIGGAPLWPRLADRAAGLGLRLATTYGMTETAAMIAAQNPEEFLAGNRSCGRVMPHARVTVSPQDGVITVAGESLFRGYWPNWNDRRELTTEDLGRIDTKGNLHILGRRDAVILTGGKKVHPTEVETVLRASGEFSDVAVVGVPDQEWGERVVAFYPERSGARPDCERASAGLAGYQRPKQFIPVADWPRNAQGKLNRAVLREIVRNWTAVAR